MSFMSEVRAAVTRKKVQKVLAMAGLMAVASSAAAAELAAFAALGEFICGIATFINTKYLFVAGLVMIVIGAIGIATSESTIMKFISVICIGIGIASAAPSIMTVFGVAKACSGF